MNNYTYKYINAIVFKFFKELENVREDGVLTYYQLKDINCRVDTDCFIFEIDIFKSNMPIYDTSNINVIKTQEVIYFNFKDRNFTNHYYPTIFEKHLNHTLDKGTYSLQEMMKQSECLRNYINSLPEYKKDKQETFTEYINRLIPKARQLSKEEKEMQELKDKVFNALIESSEVIHKDRLMWKSDNELIYLNKGGTHTLRGYIKYNFNKDKFSYVNFTGNSYEYKNTQFHKIIRYVVDKDKLITPKEFVKELESNNNELFKELLNGRKIIC